MWHCEETSVGTPQMVGDNERLLVMRDLGGRPFRASSACLAICISLAAWGCQRESPKSQAKDSEKSVRSVVDSGKQKLLVGDANAPARSAIHNYDALTPPPNPSEVGTTASGAKINRTLLSIAFTREATIGEVNALLMLVGASIVVMIDKVHILEVKIPDPGDLASYEAIIALLRADPVVRYTTKGTMLFSL